MADILQNVKSELEYVLSLTDYSAELSDVQRDVLERIFVCSPFFSQSIKRNPGLLEHVIKDASIGLAEFFNYEEMISALSSCDDMQTLDRLLREYRNLNMLRILWLDQSESIVLTDILRLLSELADLMIEQCLQWHYHKLAGRHGYPLSQSGQHLALMVLAMGKLGGYELNYSSDIDLILCYESDGSTQGKYSLSHQEFFHKLAQRLHCSLSSINEDGFVFRVDLRLRPYGKSGPLVMSFSAIEDYYQTQGREWERYAMIKARPVGTTTEAGRRLLDILKPFVYRRYLDFGVIQSLRELKAMIDREVARKDRQDNLKLGSGGIREIEFIAQVFQLMRGGQDTTLQERNTLLILKRLADKQYLDSEDVEGLILAWKFLRTTENHLQEMYDCQEHMLPRNAEDQFRLACSMRFRDWDSFLEVLNGHRDHVQRCFDGIFSERKSSQDEAIKAYWLSINELGDGEQLLLGEEDCCMLKKRGYIQPDHLHKQLCMFKFHGVYPHLSSSGQKLCDDLISILVEESTHQGEPDEAMLRILPVIQAIARRESYLALLLEEVSVRQQLVQLCVASQWVAKTIARYPMLLDELVDPETLYAPPDQQGLNVDLSRVLADIDTRDIEMQMDRLRHFKQAQQLRIAAADITNALPLMQVSDHLSWIAESLLHVALDMAWEEMIRRYGEPVYFHENTLKYAGFVVIGFGKLGGIEMSYDSDLDLVFLHDSHGTQQVTNGKNSIDNAVFFTRLAQRVVHILSTLTPVGVLYEIDTRLRPNGQSGMLVSSLQAFEDYQKTIAWTWEHQALVRARYITGDTAIGREFERIRRDILSLSREQDRTRQEILDMRRTMRAELDRSQGDQFDLKHGIGGIVDIEFMVQCAVLNGGHRYPQLHRYTDVVRILETACEINWVDAAQGRVLIESYRLYRAAIHHRVLQGLDRCVAPGDFKANREAVMAAWLSFFDEQA